METASHPEEGRGRTPLGLRVHRLRLSGAVLAGALAVGTAAVIGARALGGDAGAALFWTGTPLLVACCLAAVLGFRRAAPYLDPQRAQEAQQLVSELTGALLRAWKASEPLLGRLERLASALEALGSRSSWLGNAAGALRAAEVKDFAQALLREGRAAQEALLGLSENVERGEFQGAAARLRELRDAAESLRDALSPK